MRLCKEKERAMSDNKKIITNVSNGINHLLDKGLKISVANKDTFYLYSTDKKLLATLVLFKDGGKKPEHSIFLDGVSGVKTFNLSEDVYKRFYNYVNRKYNHDSLLGQDVDKTQFTFSDMTKLWKDMGAGKSVVKEEKFLEALIHGLIARRCPINYIQRVFFCFEKPDAKQHFDRQFTVLNTENKLVEYKTPRGKQWFFTGKKNSSGKFMPMDEDGIQLFNAVKIALQKQKQNVK